MRSGPRWDLDGPMYYRFIVADDSRRLFVFQEVPMNDWSQVVTWLVTGGSVAAVAWFASWYLEPMVWWQKISSQNRALIILGLSLVIGMVATFLAGLPPEQLEPFLPYLNGLVLTIVAWLSSQVFHRADSKAK